MSELVGRVIGGRYRVEAFIGKGGMAEVYKVWDQNRSVFLAMKVLHGDLAEDKVFLRRFRREAQTLSKLQHPNIVRLYGLEQADELVFMLMDYVEGTTLRKEIFQSNGPFSTQRILEIMRPICAALHYAHESGFAHCDVKPANIMIHVNGTILVADFGIARMTEASTATMVGAGTPAYMAPEQIRGGDPTPQTDIYALGVILYELLSGGERPFTGEHARTTGSTSEKIRWEQLNVDPVPLAQFNPKVSAAMVAVVGKCLEKEPMKRFATVTEFLTNLMKAAASTEKPIPAPKKAALPKVQEGPADIPLPPAPAKEQSFSPAAAAPPVPRSRSKQILFGLAAVVIMGAAGTAIVFFLGIKSLASRTGTSFLGAAQPLPTLSATPASSPTTSAPTTSAPTLTTTPTGPQASIIGSGVVMHGGPGLVYPEVGRKLYGPGDTVTIIARDPNNQWFLARSKDGTVGWLLSGWLTTPTHLSSISIAATMPPAPPTPTKKPKEAGQGKGKSGYP